MTQFEQKPEHYWWTKKNSYLIYFIREINGIILGLLAFLFALFTLINYYIPTPPTRVIYTLLIYLLQASSIIFTITWLIAMPQITPFQTPAWLKRILAITLVIIWITLSYLISNYAFLYHP